MSVGPPRPPSAEIERAGLFQVLALELGAKLEERATICAAAGMRDATLAVRQLRLTARELAEGFAAFAVRPGTSLARLELVNRFDRLRAEAAAHGVT